MAVKRALLAFILCTASLTACARVEPTSVPTVPANPTTVPLPSVTPAPVRTPTPIVTCTETTGQLLHLEIEIPGDDRPLTYWLYLPPCFNADRKSAYPTLYLLHGLAQSDSEWIDIGVAATADRLITRGVISAIIIVMPGERTGFDMLAAVTDVLLPEIEGSLPSGGESGLRAIGGLSRGAGWALRIGMQRPDLFGAIGVHSPAVISPDLYSLPTWAAEVPADSIPRLWVDIGTEDTLLRDALELRERLDTIRWPYTWSLDQGEHTSTYWSGHLEQYLLWYADAWPTQDPTGKVSQP